MLIDKTPGINVMFEFNSNYTIRKPLDIKQLLDKPEREKHGFYWELNPIFIKQTRKYKTDAKFFGFYISSQEEAGVSLALFNRAFYLAFIELFKSWEKHEDSYKRIDPNILSRIDSIRWDGFYENLKDSFNIYYLPFKKFLASKRPEKCWVSFSDHSFSPNDPIYSDFLCGIQSVDLSTIGSFIESKTWESAIKEGPLANPEILITERFFQTFPGSIKFAPETISKRFDVDDLEELHKYGII
jgi:hypothetical protein